MVNEEETKLEEEPSYCPLISGFNNKKKRKKVLYRAIVENEYKFGK